MAEKPSKADDELRRLADPATHLRAAIDYALSASFDEALDALEWLRAWREGDKRREEVSYGERRSHAE